MKKWTLLFLITWPWTALAQSTATCTDIYETPGAYVVQRFQGQRNCYLMATPQTGVDYYRAPVLSNQGVFMVFNSYEYSRGTDGSRVFYFFPRNRLPEFYLNAQQEIVLATATQGIDIILSATKLSFRGFLGGHLHEDPSVRTTNQGGVELSDVQTLWLDAGFQLGADPTADTHRTSRFTDSRGHTCVVPNSAIFIPVGDADAAFRWNDEELKLFLAQSCPDLVPNW